MSAREHRKTAIAGQPLQPETMMLGYGFDPRLSEGAVKSPVFLTSTFVFRSCEEGRQLFDYASGRQPCPEGADAGLIYTRFNNPNLQILEERLAVLEGTDSSAVFASGMAAIATTLLALAKPGESILHSRPLYGGTEALLAKVLSERGIHASGFTDGTDIEAIRRAAEACQGPIAVILAETPANPTNAVVDIALLAEIADEIEKRQGKRPVVAVDNTFMGPLFQSPLALGADLSIYSLTKYAGGHSDLIAGAVVGPAAQVEPVRALRGLLGSQLDAHSAWMLMRSLETMRLRMEKAFDNAAKVAAWLASRPQVERVEYPGFAPVSKAARKIMERQCRGAGATFAFTVKGGREAAYALLDNLQIVKLAVSLGGTESLACHPATTTHSGLSVEERQALGITEGMVRLSVGIEAAEDLIGDLAQAMSHIR
jgi:methionine-gamma-lyase